MHKKVICAFVLAVLVCASAWADVPLTAEYFPDDTFREYISQNFDNGDGVLSDAEIEQITALPVGLAYSYDQLSDVLTSSPSNELSTVHDFTGIEYLTSLEALYYEELFRFGQQNLLADIDLSKNTRLQFLHFIPAELSALDLSANAALLYVECQESGLSSLDVSGCSRLVYLNCSNNSLSALDVSGSMSLIHLDFSNNSAADIDLSGHSQLQYLFCANNDLSELPLPDNRILSNLNCSSNHLPRLRLDRYYVLNMPDCSSQSIIGSYVTQTGNNYTFDMSTLIPSDELSRVSNVEAYDSNGNTISIITDGGGHYNLSSAPSRITYLYDTQRASMDVTISSIDVRENFPPVITTQSLPQGKQNVYYETTITATGDLPLSWDIQGLPEALSYDHDASGDRVIISGIPIVSGSFDVTALVSNDVSSDTKIILLEIVPDDNDNIPITDEEFGALSKDLASPDVDNDPPDGKLDKKERDGVTTLPKNLGHNYPNYPMRYWPRGIGWPSRGFYHFRYLRELYISGGWGGSSWPGKGDGSGGGFGGGGLDLSGNADLEVLIIENVYLGKIDLSKNTKLKVLILINCGLTELDLSKNTQLEYLDCSYNYLTVLNLSVNISLRYLNCSYNYLTWINLQASTALQEVVCSPQEVTGELKDSGNAAYPYSFDLRELMTEDRLVNIDAGTITADVDVSPQNYILRFRRIAKSVKYYYRVEIIANLFMEVNIKLTYNGTTPTQPDTTTRIITTNIASGKAGSSYSFNLNGQGTGTLTWDIISGSLPAGLTLNTNGTISGTTSSTGTFSFTVRLSASGGGSTTRAFTITIDSQDDPDDAAIAPRITSRTLPEGTVSISYTYQLTATGTLPLTWRITSGSLPPGLTMNTSGRITGTPTTAGTYRFTVRVENGVGYDELELVIIIRTTTGTNITSNDGIPPDIIAMFTLRNGYVGAWYNVSIYAEGTRVISWRITDGSLPPGLSINSDGTITGTPTAAGEYTFTVEAVNNWGRDVAIFVINIYASSGKSGTDSDGTGIIYEYTRTINSLTEYELALLPSDIYIIAAVLPRFRVTVSGTYRFVVNLYETVQAGLTLVWFPFPVNGSGGGTASFLDSSGTTITVSPSTRRVVVSVYLEADTYAPVIAILRPSEPESPDVKPNTGGGGGGGCNSSSGALMLGLLAALPFFRKR